MSFEGSRGIKGGQRTLEEKLDGRTRSAIVRKCGQGRGLMTHVIFIVGHVGRFGVGFEMEGKGRRRRRRCRVAEARLADRSLNALVGGDDVERGG